MLRGIIKDAAALALDAFGVHRIATPGRSSKHEPLVVGYHQVVRRFRGDGRHGIAALQTSASMFEQHLDWIAGHYRFVSLDELGERLREGAPFEKPAAAITFDDGYENVYRNAFPILKRKGIPAAVFVVTGLVETSSPPLHDRLYLLVERGFSRWSRPDRELGRRVEKFNGDGGGMNGVPTPFAATRRLLETLRRSELQQFTDRMAVEFAIEPGALEEARPLSWSMIREMSAAGITIGSHSVSHPLLTAESDEQVREEAAVSKTTLEERLNAPVLHFAYPDGRFNAGTAQAVAGAGYRYAYTICSHRLETSPLMSIPRKVLWEKSCVTSSGRFSPAVMNCQAHGLFDWIRKCPQAHDAGTTHPAPAADARNRGGLRRAAGEISK